MALSKEKIEYYDRWTYDTTIYLNTHPNTGAKVEGDVYNFPVLIRLQNTAGSRVTFGKTRSTGEPGQYEVVYQYIQRDVGLEALPLGRGAEDVDDGGPLVREGGPVVDVAGSRALRRGLGGDPRAARRARRAAPHDAGLREH